MKMKKLLAVLLTMIMVIGIVACGGDKKEDTKETEAAKEKAEEKAEEKVEEKAEEKAEKKAEETEAEKAEEPAGEAKDNSEIVVGFSSKDNSDQFVKQIADAAQSKADELGIQLLMSDAAGDVNKQISDVETFIAQGVDAVVVIPQSVEGSAPVVSLCNDAGIPIVVDNGDIADTNYTAFVGCTDQESGEILGQWFVDNLEAGSKVCILEGPMGQSGQVGRYAGFEAVGVLDTFEVLAIQTANWKRDEAMALAEDWITTFGDDLDAIICQNDDMAIGALSAVEAAGRTDIIIGGVDGLEEAVQAVKEGRMAISVLQDSQGQGEVGVEVAVKAAKGEEVPYDTRIPFRAITAENVDAYLEGGVDAISD